MGAKCQWLRPMMNTIPVLTCDASELDLGLVQLLLVSLAEQLLFDGDAVADERLRAPQQLLVLVQHQVQHPRVHQHLRRLLRLVQRYPTRRHRVGPPSGLLRLRRSGFCDHETSSDFVLICLQQIYLSTN